MVKKWAFLISLVCIISILSGCNGSPLAGTVSPIPSSTITSPASPYIGSHGNPVTPQISNPKPGWTIFNGFAYKDFGVTTILRDNKGNIWFGSWGPYQSTIVYKFDGSNWTHFDIPLVNGRDNTAIRAIVQDNGGNIWFGTFGSGVIKYDGNKFTAFTKENGLLAGDSISSLYKDKKGNIWASALDYFDKVFYYDGNKWQLFDVKYALEREPDKTVNIIYQDRDSNMWFGTSAGLSVFDGTNWRTFSEEYYGPSSSNPYHDIISIFQDGNGNMWFGGRSGGVTRYDGKNWTIFKYDVLPYERVNNIVEDSKGTIWFSTQDGLNYAVVKHDGSNWNIFTGAGELPDGDTVKSVIYKDDLGNFWFGLNSGGVASYSPG